MKTLPLFKMDKDKGYAWVILGASTILMCVGPSTYSSYGFLLRDVKVTYANKTWILNIFYICWLLSAFLVSCFVKQRPRQLATSGAALAAIGFLTSATMVDDDIGWLYLTFSLFVGCGLGLSFHTAYLVVMSNFDHYKGLANGVCQLCIAIGQITTPFLFTIVSLPRDRFQIKSLTTAVGFLTTLFFVVPTNIQPRRPTLVGDRNRRLSTVSRRSSQGEAVPLQSGFIPVPSNNIPINNQPLTRPRRRSQYLLAVSTSLLPNIPEEPESAHSTNDTLTSASSESDLGNQQPSLASQSVAVIGPDTDMWGTLAPITPLRNYQKVTTENEKETRDTTANVNQHVPLRRLSEGCMPTYVGNNMVKSNQTTETSSNVRKVSLVESNTSPTTGVGNKSKKTAPKVRRYSESQLGSKNSLSATQTPLTEDLIANNMKNQDSRNAVNKQQLKQELPNSKTPINNTNSGGVGGGMRGVGESFIDLRLLKDYQFLNMASFSALCTMTVVNYPIVLYVYIISTFSTCEGCTKEADVALIIIYMVDLISRLLFSYLADIAAFSKRRSFHVGCACAGVLIATTTVIDDVTLIYCYCVVYGICLGLIMTSEYLMFIECFGFQRFPHAYGLVNLCKIVVIAVLGIIAINPLSVYQYPIHPLDQDDTPRNSSTFDILDSSLPASLASTRILLGLAVPSFLCTLAWLMEDIYKVALRRCSIHHAPEKMDTRNMNIA